jgi:hypothetical protein
MGKAIPDADLDLEADDLIAHGNSMVVCSGQPANYAGVAAVTLATVALAGGDYTKAAGAVDGRKVTVAAKSGLVPSGGTATHIVIVDTVNTVLKRVTTCTSLVLTAGVPINIPAWSITFRAPI